MPEMVIPGTYIDVRAEGLISAGGVTTGVVGMIGTASSGPVGVPVTLSGMAQAHDLYGAPDSFLVPTDGSNPLTLTRALQYTYGNGASTVVAVRVASPRASAAHYALKDGAGNTIATLVAATPGTWGNNVQISVDAAKTPARITGERQTSGFSALKYHRVLPTPQNRIQVIRGDTRRVDTFDIVYKSITSGESVAKNSSGTFQLANAPVAQVASINSVTVLDADGNPVRAYGANPPPGVTAGTIVYDIAATPALNELRLNPSTGELAFEASQVPAAGQSVRATYAVDHGAAAAGEVLVTVWNGNLDFHTGEGPRAASGDTLAANYSVEAADSVQITLSWGQSKETYSVPDGNTLATLAATSTLITVAPDATFGGAKPAAGVAAYFGTGSNLGGADGADAGEDEYAAALEAISNRIVNIVVLAGQDANTMGSVLLDHLKATEETDFERIGVIGVAGRTVAEFLGHNIANDRVILVAPGIQLADGSTLPPAYTSAAVAGMISSLPVQTSLTNKPINLPGIALNANRGEQTQLIQRDVLTIVVKEGLRVLKGVTSEGVGEPYSAIPTRRIVDYAKYGVRSAANPYIGRLNNSRVRAALKATLDAFLTGMVQDEALTGYLLDVTATRAQEIAGQVSVVMTIQPVFSIDFIRVVMTLQ
jgi:tail sheath protein